MKRSIAGLCAATRVATEVSRGVRRTLIGMVEAMLVLALVAGPSAAQVGSLPNKPVLTFIPHFVIGGGFVTVVSVKNLATSNNNLILQFLNQNGSAGPSAPLTLAPGQTLERSSGEENRSAPIAIEWIAIGSDGPISASVLFNCCAAGNQVASAAGVLPQASGTTFTAPFIFQRQLTGTQPILAEGLGIANISSSPNTVTVGVLDQKGNRVSTDTVDISNPFGQTAFTVSSDLPNISAYLQGKDSFLGSLVITGTKLIAPVIVGNLGGKLFSLPLVASGFSVEAGATEPGGQTAQNNQAAALPGSTNLTLIPHFVIGGGFVTRLLVKNLVSNSNNLILQFMNQDGTVASTQPPVALTGSQTFLYTSGESTRNGPQTTQWIAIGSDFSITASALFDCCATGDQVTSAVGVLAQAAGTTFTTPFKFQRQLTSQPILVQGLGVANQSGSSNSVTVQLLDQMGTLISTDNLAAIAGFGQTAFVVSDLPNVSAQLQSQNTFLGSLVINGSQPLAPVIVGNIGGRLFSLPLSSGGAVVGGGGGPASVSISPNTATVQTGNSQRFSPTMTGSIDTALTWSVNDIVGGNATVGTISDTGLYTAPSSVPSPSNVTVKATSVADPTKFGTARVNVTQAVAPNPVSVMSLDKQSASPFTPLTITGTGFDPTGSAISVLFIPASGVPFAVPVFSVTPTTLVTIVPPLLDPTTGMSTSGTVGIQLIQASGTYLTTSNIIPNFTIGAAPSLSVAAGSVTAAYLNAGSNVVQSVQSIASSSPTLAGLSLALSTFSAQLIQLLPSVQRIISNPSATITLTTPNGQPFTLNSQTLAILDQLIVSYLQNFVGKIGAGVSGPSGAAVTACPPSSGDSNVDIAICNFQRFHQQMPQNSAQTTQQAANLMTGFYLSFLSGWPAQGLGGTGAPAASAAKAFAFLFGSTAPFMSAYATAGTPPPLSEALRDVGAKALDTYNAWGLSVPSANVTGLTVYSTAQDIAFDPVGPSPQGGLNVSSSPSNVPSGSNPIFGFRGSGATATDPRLAVPPTQVTATVASVTLSPPNVPQFNGSYAFTIGGIFTSPDGSTSTDVGGTFRISINNGTITGDLQISGTIDALGNANMTAFHAQPPATCPLKGKFVVSSSGAVTGSGDYACSFGSQGSSSGSWTAVRQ